MHFHLSSTLKCSHVLQWPHQNREASVSPLCRSGTAWPEVVHLSANVPTAGTHPGVHSSPSATASDSHSNSRHLLHSPGPDVTLCSLWNSSPLSRSTACLLADTKCCCLRKLLGICCSAPKHRLHSHSRARCTSVLLPAIKAWRINHRPQIQP